MQSREIIFQGLDRSMEARLRNEPSDTLYENIVAQLDELLDSQLTALIEAVRAVQVDRETEMILAEAV